MSEQYRQALLRQPVSTLRRVFEMHVAWSRDTGHIYGKPAWDDDGLNVIGVRMNPVTNFYVKGSEDWNDFLILVTPVAVTVLACTVDPARVNVNPAGVAHLHEGVWASYVRGSHKLPWRTALVQAKGPVEVVRTDHKGKILQTDFGWFGINVHNAAGWNKPSAGCTVIKPEKVMGVHDRNFQQFKSILKAAPDRPVRSYCLVNREQLASYVQELSHA